MRISHVILDESYEKQVLSLEIIREYGAVHDFCLIAPKKHENLTDVGGRVKFIALGEDFQEKNMLRKLVVLYNNAVRARPDIIHFFSSGVLASILRHVSGARAVVTLWGKEGRETLSNSATIVSHGFTNLSYRGKNASVRILGHTPFSLSSGGSFAPVRSDFPESLILFDVRGADKLSLSLRAFSLVSSAYSVKGVFILSRERFAFAYKEASLLGVLDKIRLISPSEAGSIPPNKCLCAVCIADGVYQPLSVHYFSSLGIPIVSEGSFRHSLSVREGEGALYFKCGSSYSLADSILAILFDKALFRRLSYGSYLASGILEGRSLVGEYGRIYSSFSPS